MTFDYSHRFLTSPFVIREVSSSKLIGAEAETHNQTLSRGSRLLQKKGGKTVGAREFEDTKRTKPTESTNQFSQRLE